ncbi:MAG TPA: hypothetical protein VF074_00065 [Pyrinomonadaceae bacterium]
MSSEPRMPGMMITGRLPLLVLASAKIRARSGLRRAEIQPTEIDSSRSTRSRSRRQEQEAGGSGSRQRQEAGAIFLDDK